MSVPKATGWKPGEMPTAAAGLKIEALATRLEHPRTLYTLPNGDILVVESNSPGTEPFRPKDFIAGKMKARAGAGAKGGNGITLLRDAAGTRRRAEGARPAQKPHSLLPNPPTHRQVPESS
jgi:glucose/arabinose dehydrogenase